MIDWRNRPFDVFLIVNEEITNSKSNRKVNLSSPANRLTMTFVFSANLPTFQSPRLTNALMRSETEEFVTYDQKNLQN